ncbi:MAG: hypothetical protein H6985_19965 [Pseudomonadales bacterium]|nr:hypothetical protein [Pseudomonadales bacterium]
MIAVFAGRSPDRTPLELFRLRNLLLGASIPAFMAFVSLGLVSLLSDELMAWRLSCAIAVFFYIVFISVILLGRANLPTGQRAMIQQPILYAALILLVVLIMAHIVAATQIVRVDAFAVFYFGLISILLLSIYQFIRAVLESVRLSGQDAERRPD